MRSPAAAIGWELRRRYRWGFFAVAMYLAAVAVVRLLVLQGGRVKFADAESFAFVVIVPLTSTFIYFLAVFSFGLSGDLAARQSIYPARMFTLPVTNAALAGWPMLYGCVATAVLWLATRFLGVWPAGSEIPTIWPVLLGASLLAWTQALTWMSYPLPGLRVVVTVLWLCVIDAIVMIALQFKPGEWLMLALLAPHVPLAFVVARSAVARARRGDVPDWSRASKRSVARKIDFSSAARAQLWFEWQRHGRTLPALVAFVLPFELAMLFIFRETPVIIFETLDAALLTPPFMALFVAATVSSEPTPFLATRPMSDTSLIAAKLKATLRSTIAAWILVIVAIPIALKLSGTAAVVTDWMRSVVEGVGRAHAIGLAVAGLMALMASTWKVLVQSLFIGMSGRAWLIKASVFVPLTILAVIVPLGHWVLTTSAVFTFVWHSLPTVIAIVAVIKTAAAVWIVLRLRGLVRDRTLVIAALCWDAAVFAVYAALMWLVPMMLLHGDLMALLAILAVPLVRLSAAPLALAWSRHR